MGLCSVKVKALRKTMQKQRGGINALRSRDTHQHNSTSDSISLKVKVLCKTMSRRNSGSYWPARIRKNRDIVQKQLSASQVTELQA